METPRAVRAKILVGGQCVGEVNNNGVYEMTGWANFDHHAWHTYGFKWENTGNNTTDQKTYLLDGRGDGRAPPWRDHERLRMAMFRSINRALGGTLGGPIQITDWADAHLDVDYIRWIQTGQRNA